MRIASSMQAVSVRRGKLHLAVAAGVVGGCVWAGRGGGGGRESTNSDVAEQEWRRRAGSR